MLQFYRSIIFTFVNYVEILVSLQVTANISGRSRQIFKPWKFSFVEKYPTSIAKISYSYMNDSLSFRVCS